MRLQNPIGRRVPAKGTIDANGSFGIAVRFDEGLWDEVQRLAIAANLPMAEMIRTLARESLERRRAARAA